jgi:copper chaperone CopZ
MNIQKSILLIAVTIFTFYSCETAPKKTPKNTIETTANTQKMSFHISGMTCEIGCAKTIQSKLSKKSGISTATVIFKDSLGLVEFDENTISKEEITAFVSGIAGGDLYNVTDVKSVTSFDEAAN